MLFIKKKENKQNWHAQAIHVSDERTISLKIGEINPRVKF